MTSPWPSDTPRQARGSKAPKGKAYPVEWASGWLVMLLAVAVPAVVLIMLWPLAATALDSIQHLTDTLTNAARNALI
jgi:hypothetical protein